MSLARSGNHLSHNLCVICSCRVQVMSSRVLSFHGVTFDHEGVALTPSLFLCTPQKLFHQVDWTKWHFHLDEEEEEEEEEEEDE